MTTRGLGEWVYQFIPPRGRHKTVAVVKAWEAYFDESSDSKGQLLYVVAGLVGSSSRFRSLERDWKRITKGRVFHAKDFFGRGRNGERFGEYADWSDAKAERFIRHLCLAIKTSGLTAVGCTIEVPPFKALSLGARRYLTSALFRSKHQTWKGTGAPTRAYQLGFLHCVATATNVERKEGSLVHFWFDRNNREEPLARISFRDILEPIKENEVRDCLGELVFADKARYEALQAADLIAYCGCSIRLKKGRLNNMDLVVAGTELRSIPRKRQKFCIYDAAALDRAVGDVPDAVRAVWWGHSQGQVA